VAGGDDDFGVEEKELESSQSADSDFDKPEDPTLELEVLGKESDEKEKKKPKKNVYVDPKKAQRGKKRSAPPSTAAEMASDASSEDKSDKSAKRVKKEFLRDVPQTDRKLRKKNTDTKEGKDGKQPEKKKEAKESKKRVHKLSQAELLAEAKAMEADNLQAYAEMKRIEEEKKKPPPKRKPIVGPKVTTFHNQKGSFILLENFKQPPAEIESISPPYPVQSFCVVTGQRAKYRDSLTGKPYSTLEAFKAIREKYNKEQHELVSKPYRDFQATQIELVEEEIIKIDNMSYEGFGVEDPEKKALTNPEYSQTSNDLQPVTENTNVIPQSQIEQNNFF